MAKDIGDMTLVYSNTISLEQAEAAARTVVRYVPADEQLEIMRMLGLAE